MTRSNTFFIRWRPVSEAQRVEYLPLYAMLLLSAIPALRRFPARLPSFTRRLRLRLISAKAEAS